MPERKSVMDEEMEVKEWKEEGRKREEKEKVQERWKENVGREQMKGQNKERERKINEARGGGR
jgi:hypothetical protein